jgi:hypothetical protein
MIGSFGGRKLICSINLVQDIVGTLEHQCKPVMSMVQLETFEFTAKNQDFFPRLQGVLENNGNK